MKDTTTTRQALYRLAAQGCALVALAAGLAGCSDSSDDDPRVIRETGYLHCETGSDCPGQLTCATEEGDTRCVSFPSTCDTLTCDCLGEAICGDSTCSTVGDQLMCSTGSGCGTYAIGDTWQEACNTCTCTEDGPTCTEAACACGEYEIGDTWQEDCNTCTCTEDGPACTLLGCVDTCEEIELNYTALVSGAKDCASDDACQLLFGQCGVGIGGCYEAV
ncbi:MAG: hypothetical protein AAFX99_02840, partial [Myxococcota bacterium]